MRRWIWKALLAAAAVLALTGTAMAEEVRYPATGSNSIIYELDTGTVVGPVNKAAITNAKIPAQVNGKDITIIAEGAFDSCNVLKTVEIAKNVTTIKKGAFNGCSQLASVFFSKNSSLTTIEEDAFAGCGQLNDVILPDQLSSIKAGTFDGCGKLSSIYIPTSVQKIEADAFYLDTNLTILHYAGQDTTKLIQEDKVPRAVHYSRMREPTQALDPTCTAEGKEIITIGCGECNRVLITQERAVPALGHLKGEKIDAVAATCVKGGFEEGYWCARPGCGGIAEGRAPVPKDPDNHESTNVKDIPNKDATCTEEGTTGGKRCQACGKVTEEPTEVDALGHDYTTGDVKTEERILKEATCTEAGAKYEYKLCTRCGEVEVCEDCANLSGDETKETEYLAHLEAQHNLQETAALDHTPGEAEYVVTKPATCVDEGEETWKVVCTVCGEAIEDGENPPEGKTRVIPATGHTVEKIVDEDASTAATCTEEGETVYKEAACAVCGIMVTPEPETVDALGHDLKDQPDKVVEKATCTKKGEKWVNYKTCQREGCDYEEYDAEETAMAHDWTDPVQDESKENVPATCGREGKAHVIVTCSECKRTEAQTITVPATGAHSWGEWTTAKEPTKTEAGEKKRVCSVCGKEDVMVLPAEGDSGGGSGDPEKPEKPETYQISVVQGAGGSASVNKKTAAAGDQVTVTVWTESGYAVDMVRVISANGGAPRLTNLGGGQYRFTMPASNVEVRATFERRNSGGGSSGWASDPGEGSSGNPRRTTDPMPTQNPVQSVPRAWAYGQLFQDIPASHWAAGEINWANQMGYMNGSGGRFNPDGNITHQQMWMVLARITGSRPGNMAEARRWAVDYSFASGAAPEGAVARHQLVTALYRCAHLMGRANQNTTSLAGYADSRTVPSAARDAFSWAVANGIVGGTAGGRLDPNGTLTRAQFAVILYRFSQRA